MKDFQDFEIELDSLQSHPCGERIPKLTHFAHGNITLATDIVKAITIRLRHPNIPSNFIWPIYCVMDSILKNVHGAYNTMLSREITNLWEISYNNIPEPMQPKMNKLLKTWDDAKLFTDAIRKQLHQISEGNVNPRKRMMDDAPPSSSSSSSSNNNDNGQHQQPQTQLQRQNQLQQQQMLQHSKLSNEEFDKLLNQEMELLLTKLTKSLNSTDMHITLDELKAINSELHINIKAAAAATLQSKIKSNDRRQDIVEGYIDGNKCFVNATNAETLVERLISQHENMIQTLTSLSKDNNKRLRGVESLSVSIGLRDMLRNVHYTPPLPSILDEDLSDPALLRLVSERVEAEIKKQQQDALKEQQEHQKALEELETARLAQLERAQQMDDAAQKPLRELTPIPPMRQQDLGRNPRDVVSELYGQQAHVCSDDGIRFRTSEELQKHKDALFIKNKEILTLTGNGHDGAGMRHREWHCNLVQWATDFGSLLDQNKENMAEIGDNSNNNNNQLIDNLNYEDFLLPLDARFEKCPVCHERFDTKWDETLQDMVSVDAVQLLIPEIYGANLFHLGIETGNPGVRLIVVKVSYVLSPWIKSGKVASIQDAVAKFRENDRAFADALVQAMDEENFESKVYVLIEGDSAREDDTEVKE